MSDETNQGHEQESPDQYVNRMADKFAEQLREKHPDWTVEQVDEFLAGWVRSLTGEAPAKPTEGTNATDTLSAGLTETQQKFIDDDETAINKLASLTADTLDPKDALRKYVKLGNEGLKIANRRRNSFKLWDKSDFDAMCAELGRKVKLLVAVKVVEMAKYIRVAAWVDAAKVLVPDADKLPYGVVVNHFVPKTLIFDAATLKGEIKTDWLTWVRTTVERQMGTEPLSHSDLIASFDVQAKAIDAAKKAKLNPEKALEQERKAAESKSRKERAAAQTKIGNAIDEAILADHATPADVMQIAETIMKSHGTEMPAQTIEFSRWATATKDDCKTLTDVLYSSGKYVEMRFLRDRLDAMIKTMENGVIKTMAG